MAEHRRIDHLPEGERFWPLDDGKTTRGCHECDRAIIQFLADVEWGLRLSCLELWTAGWSAEELLDEVRRATGCPEAVTLMAQVLLVDDSQRSEQARPAEWQSEIVAVRARTGITDVSPGWLAAWMVDQPSARQASDCLKAVTAALGALTFPTIPTFPGVA